jgi:hypothetical protein
MTDESNYYEENEWYSPFELAIIAANMIDTDPAAGAMLSALGVIRTENDMELEMEFINHIRSFLKKHVESFDEIDKRGKAKYN